jgi:RepB plasmid partitioning protein/Protein kinase domain
MSENSRIPPPSEDWLPGQLLLGDYEVQRVLGQGGMGKVYLVLSRKTGMLFAVKRALIEGDRDKQNFLSELQTWIDLPAHPHIAACRFFRTIGNEIAIFAEYVGGGTLADCILSTDDESFTYNARVSRVTAIQEHVMISKAVKSGVAPARIAASLNLQLAYVHSILNLLQGVHRDAVELLKEKPITRNAVTLLKRVNESRQIEMAELMTSVNNFSAAYIQALILGTPQDQMTRPDKPKVKSKLTPKEQARMEHEMATLEHDSRASEDDYGKICSTLLS